MRVLVLLNCSAGTHPQEVSAAAVIERVRTAMDKAGIDAEVRTVPPAQLAAEARDAAGSGVDAVVAAGGDGTSNAVASGLLGSDTPLGVLPLGTRNHFARQVGMPQALEQAAAALGAAQVRAVDVGQVNDHLFLNNASIGLYPRLVGRREELRRRRFSGRWMAMIFATLSALRRFPTLRVRIVVDQQTVYCDTPFVFVGNNRYEISGLALGERPCLDRGELGLYFASRAGRFAMFRLALRALLGRLEQSKDFQAMTASELWLETGRRHVHVATDGELCRLSPPLHFRCAARGLNILAPPEFRATCSAETQDAYSRR